MTVTVKPMKKVRLRVSKSAGDPVHIEFIFGVASDGLTPFESALSGAKQGDCFPIAVPSAGAWDYFGHCLPDFRQTIGLAIMPSMINLHIEVAEVTDPENREVVQSLAKTISHGGCGGSCGCGCG